MGIMKDPESPDRTTASTAKRKSRTIDLSALKPLKADKGTTGFAGYREQKQRNGTKRRDEDDMDSDVEDDGPVTSAKRSPKVKKEPTDEDTNGAFDDESRDVLSPEEFSKRAELAEGVKKMQLKRQHSFDPSQGRHISQTVAQEPASLSQDPPTLGSTPESSVLSPSRPQSQASRLTETEAAAISSPFKKPRASVSTLSRSEAPPLNFNPPAPESSVNAPASAIAAPDISFMRTEAQPNFSSASGGKVSETVGNAEDASTVPLPPPTASGGVAVKQEAEGMDEEL